MTSTELTPIPDDDEWQGPEKGTPETALILVYQSDDFRVLAHTGRYFYVMIELAGYTGEEVGIEGLPDDEPGFYVLENGRVTESRDWETGIVDDVCIGGDVRKATLDDFARFPDVPLPIAGLTGGIRNEADD